MGYMNIAAKAIAKNQTKMAPKMKAKTKAKAMPDKNTVEKTVDQKGVKTLPSQSTPVKGTPFAALSDLMTKR